MKKLCALLALAMLISACAALAETAATPIYDSGDYTYILDDDGSARIVDWMGEDAELIVPTELDGHPVTAVEEDAFADNAALYAVELPETLEAIGDGAFSGCAALSIVTLHEGLRSIGDLAFADCEGLTDIAIPDSVETIGINPFKGCGNLVDIFVSPDHEALATVDGVLFEKGGKRLVCYPAGFMATNYAMPEGVERIGVYAFEGCVGLETVVVPDSVTEIGEAAFEGCDALTIVGGGDSPAEWYALANGLDFRKAE